MYRFRMLSSGVFSLVLLVSLSLYLTSQISNAMSAIGDHRSILCFRVPLTFTGLE